MKVNLTKKQLDEFYYKLEGPDGCNFREKKRGDPKTIIWRCKGKTDKTYAKRILKKMGITKEEIDKLVIAFEKTGGYCDCEILFNSSERLECVVKGDLKP